jgi:hypothetical protein
MRKNMFSFFSTPMRSTSPVSPVIPAAPAAINRSLPIRLRWSALGFGLIAAIIFLGCWWFAQLTDHLARYAPIDAAMYLHARDAQLPGERSLATIVPASIIDTAAAQFAVDRNFLHQLVAASKEVSIWKTGNGPDTMWSAAFLISDAEILHSADASKIIQLDHDVVALTSHTDGVSALRDVVHDRVFSLEQHVVFKKTRQQGSIFLSPTIFGSAISQSSLFQLTDKPSTPIFFPLRFRSGATTFTLPLFFPPSAGADASTYSVSATTQLAVLRVPLRDMVDAITRACESCPEVFAWLQSSEHVVTNSSAATTLLSRLASIEIATPAISNTNEPEILFWLPTISSDEQQQLQSWTRVLFATAHPTNVPLTLPDKTVATERVLDLDRWEWRDEQLDSAHQELVHGTTTYATLITSPDQTSVLTSVDESVLTRKSLSPLLRRCSTSSTFGAVLFVRLPLAADLLGAARSTVGEGVLVLAQQPTGEFLGCLSTW